MTSSAHDLSLEGLPHDVRLELFSHMNLPPFDGCQDYAGLWLSCRQLYEEANREGIRRLRIYLQNISQSPRKVGSDEASEDSPDDDEPRPNLEFLIPSSVYGRPVIGVNVPFLLPQNKHDWHLQKPPQRMCGTGRRKLLETPGPRRDAYLAERDKRYECMQQEELYKQRIDSMFGSLGDLHNLYARIEIHLVADEDVAKTITKDTTFDRKLDHHFQLTSVVLGKLLEVYLIQIRRQSFDRMQRWSEGWAFHATTIEIAWDFGSKDPTVRQEQNPWRPISCSRVATHTRALAEYTADRREGSVQMSFDVKGYLLLELKGIKDRISGMKCSLAKQEARDEAELDRQRQELAQDIRKLQKLENPKLWGIKPR